MVGVDLVAVVAVVAGGDDAAHGGADLTDLELRGYGQREQKGEENPAEHPTGFTENTRHLAPTSRIEFLPASVRALQFSAASSSPQKRDLE